MWFLSWGGKKKKITGQKKILQENWTDRTVWTQAALWNSSSFSEVYSGSSSFLLSSRPLTTQEWTLRWSTLTSAGFGEDDVQNKRETLQTESLCLTSSPWTSCPERQKYVNNHLFKKMPSGNMETYSEDLFVLCPDESPFSLFSKPFWHKRRLNLSVDRQCKLSLYCIYSINLSQLPISVFRCYGLSRTLLLDNTWDRKQCEGPNRWQVNLNWEQC